MTPTLLAQQGRSSDNVRGSAMFAALILTTLLAALAGSLLKLGVVAASETDAAGASLRALHMAETGLSEALFELAVAHRAEDDPPTAVGSQDAPRELGTGSFWVDISEEDGLVTILSVGRAGRVERALEVVARLPQSDIYSSAVFAGNDTLDPSYSLRLSGLAGQADQVLGDIYCGGDVEVAEDALVTGSVSALGTITGTVGSENVSAPLPDIAGMDYATNNDVDVAALFAADEYYASADAGGSAWQLPEESPAHIFRRNPSDRDGDWIETVKDDFFLEDPYEALRSDGDQDGSDASQITLAGQSGEPGVGGNDAVYYIDGNLWLHNRSSYSFQLASGGDGSRVTFIVKGSIYFSDNLFYGDNDQDGIAFIAIRDEDVEDSGNIYFGDPVYGTLVAMSAFMYAENNFYDYNLGAEGSAQVAVRGNMTAGNHVSIKRDYEDEHSRLTVNFDDRIRNGALDLPGLPGWQNGPPGVYTLLCWREVSARYAGP